VEAGTLRGRKEADEGTTLVLLCHRVGLPRLASAAPGQYVMPRVLASALDHLSARGWKPVSLAEAVDRCRLGSASSENEFCVTFDDGYLSVYEHALPVLARRGVPGALFVVAGAIGGVNGWDRGAGDRKEKLLSAEQIRELCGHGFEIGSHTFTHPQLTAVSDERLRRELVDSKRRIEDITGREVTSFSYPYGDYDQRVREATVAAGYKCALGTELGVINRETNLFEIPRVNVRWNAIGPILMSKIGRARKPSGLRG